MEKAKTACVIVTFNRKALLKRCLKAVCRQSYKPTTVFVVDNASTDGTLEAVRGWGYYNKEINGVSFEYVLNAINEGGAGGFCLGLKTAANSAQKFDAYWVMDDDGEPEEHCLEELVRFLGQRDYIAPIVLSDENRTSCSFIPNKSYAEVLREADENGVLEGWASPFNGILFSARLVKTIGYPKKEMFIWGDEINYQIRAEKAGFHRMTNVHAIHYHPVDRMKSIRNEDTLDDWIIVDIPDWKLYCAIRNRVYNQVRELRNKWRAVRKCFYTAKAYKHYLHKVRNDYSKDALITEALWAGLFGWFGGMKKYMK